MHKTLLERLTCAFPLIALLAAGSLPLAAQKQELALSLGAVTSGDRRSPEGELSLNSGTALQANYAYRVLGGETVALYADVHFLASPLRDVESQIPQATVDFATIYLTPGAKLKLWPNARVSPYGVVGGGLAVYEHSELDNAGNPNTASRTVNRGAFTYGAGADLRVFRWLAFRGEFRNFRTGSPELTPLLRSGPQDNRVFSAGIVLRFGA